jgi:hypothetical protein
LPRYRARRDVAFGDLLSIDVAAAPKLKKRGKPASRVNCPLKIAWRIQTMTQIGLDSPALGSVVDPATRDVGEAVSPCAFPLRVRRKFIGETSQKVVRLARIYRLPLGGGEAPAKDVNAADGEKYGANLVQIKGIESTGAAAPIDHGEGGVD